jgi:hypothetical protein
MLVAFGDRCAYYGGDNGGRRFKKEHVIPLSRGGGFTADNIVPSCRSCNARKLNKTGEEFLGLLAQERTS